MQTGKVYLIPTPLGDNEPLEVLPISIKTVVEELTYFIVENEKSARHFIKKIAPTVIQADLKFFLIDKHTKSSETSQYLNICKQGIHVGVLSEAGLPAIADPGSNIVKLAHQMGLQVVPLVGPSSILMAMMASGLNGQNFAFNGYMPIDEMHRSKHLKSLERKSGEINQSQIFIETPFRNNKLLDSLIQNLAPTTQLCIAVDITLPTEFIKTLPIADWKKEKPELHKRPAIFIIHK
jgi:16S rRNA (cytidine1402-2'-O)-methyltransferase